MKFIKDYALYIVLTIIVIAFVVAFFLPMLIGMGRDMWQWALSETRAL